MLGVTSIELMIGRTSFVGFLYAENFRFDHGVLEDPALSMIFPFSSFSQALHLVFLSFFSFTNSHYKRNTNTSLAHAPYC